MSHYLIIGASSGIGKQLSQNLAANGHSITATFSSISDTESTENIQFHRLDVTEENPDFSFLPQVIDGLIYCPGTISLKPFN